MISHILLTTVKNVFFIYISTHRLLISSSCRSRVTFLLGSHHVHFSWSPYSTSWVSYSVKHYFLQRQWSTLRSALFQMLVNIYHRKRKRNPKLENSETIVSFSPRRRFSLLTCRPWHNSCLLLWNPMSSWLTFKVFLNPSSRQKWFFWRLINVSLQAKDFG